MVIGSQILGIAFGTLMLYLTFIRSKRKEFTTKETVAWLTIWALIIVIAIFPTSLEFLSKNVLRFARTFDLLIMMALMFLTGSVFYTYGLVRQNQKKVEDVVRKIALEKK